MKFKKILITKLFFIFISSQLLFNVSKASAAEEIKIIYSIFSRTIKVNTTDEANSLNDLIIQIVPLRKFLEILQKVPGYSIDIFIKRVPRLINEPYTKEMGIKIAKKVTEKGVVRLVKIAAGANI